MIDLTTLDTRLQALARGPDIAESVRSYAQTEFDRGMQYHFDYVNRLGMYGGHVLDAGCGVGNWALALTQTYKKVTALEFNPDRLACTRQAARLAEIPDETFETIEGSIEDLPFPDSHFDGVFCNGVIFLTNWRASLRELQRVLKPGGMLYVSFDDIGWWDYLIHERGATQPSLRPMAAGMLLNQFADHLHHLPDGSKEAYLLRLKTVLSAVISAYSSPSKNYTWKDIWEISKILRAPLQYLLRHAVASATASIFRADVSLAIEVAPRVISFGSQDQKETLARDLMAVLESRPVLEDVRRGYCIGLDQMADAVRGYGLTVLGKGPEGTVVINPSRPVPPSVYAAHWGVVEVVAHKPARPEALTAFNLDLFAENARTAALRFSGLQGGPIVSNQTTADTLEQVIAARFRTAATQFDKPETLAGLVKAIDAAKPAGQPLFEAICLFVQSALFHHPVFQMSEAGGAIVTDSLSILLSGTGRCGHVATVACDLYRAAGLEARVTQLHKHLCCEVLVDGRWIVVDADAYKAGCHPRLADGRWPTLDDLRANPALLDHTPAIGQQLSPTAPWSTGIGGTQIQGYTDAGLAWERPYVSYLYFGINPGYPAAPPSVTATWTDDGVLHLSSSGKAAENLRSLRIAVGSRSRGWSYNDYPDAGYLGEAAADIALLTVSPDDLASGIKVHVNGDQNRIYLNIFALDDYQLGDQSVWLWPAPEMTLSR